MEPDSFVLETGHDLISNNIDNSERCSKCPILIKEVGVVKDMQQKMSAKINDIYNSLNGSLNVAGWLSRIESLEKTVTLFDTRLTILEEKINPILERIEGKIDKLIK
jgi:hypothetical protein